MREKKCPVCGKVFKPSGRQKYCNPKCTDIAQRNKLKSLNVEGKSRALREKSLSEVAAEARKAGMTYGQYMAREYAEQVKERRK